MPTPRAAKSSPAATAPAKAPAKSPRAPPAAASPSKSKGKAALPAASAKPAASASSLPPIPAVGAAPAKRRAPKAAPALHVEPIAQGAASQHPPVFTKDNDYYFVAAGSSIKVHSRLTGEVVSTLSARSASESGSSAARRLSTVHTDQVTALALHPANPLQLVSASLDGTLKIWDVLDATLLRSLDVGLPVTHMALHASQPGVAYVAVRKPKSNGPNDKTDPFNFTGRTNSIIYSVSLSARNNADKSKEVNGSGSLVSMKAALQLRIGKTRDAAALAVSPDGQWLVAIGNRKVQVARLASLREGFVKYVSDERLVSLAFHPHDGTFATGDVAGKIRIWYCLKTDDTGISSASAFSAAAQVTGVEKHAMSTLLHWHAHAVSGLAYAPNGAYLISGGEEAVLVLWQLQTGQREYVPRLGAPIASVAVAGGMEGRELEYVVGLADGSITFVSAVNLKPLRSFARVKIDSSRLLCSYKQLAALPAPLATHPATGQLVMSAGHPSSIQFFDAGADRHVSELEVAPSNRVSRPDDAVLEPVRVERVALSTGGAGGAEWMATYEARRGTAAESAGGALDRCLKFWRWDVREGKYALNSRIDAPHVGSITSMAFRPPAPGASYGKGAKDAVKAHPMFVSTATDGQSKTWRVVSQAVKGGKTQLYWTARSVFGFRSTTPLDSAFSPDGSLLAIAQGTFVTVWEPESNTMQTALSCPELRAARQVVFAGSGGRYLVVAGAEAVVVWDLVLGDIAWQRSFDAPIDRLFPAAHDATSFVIVSRSPVEPGSPSGARRSIVQTFDPLQPLPKSTHSVPFGVRAVTEMGALTPANSAAPAFYALSDKLDIVCVGAVPCPPAASASAQALRGVAVARRTLFDNLFGETELADGAAPLDNAREAARSNSKDVFGLFDAPAHLLPPLNALFTPFLNALLPPAQEAGQSNATGGAPLAGGAMDVDEGADADEEGADVGAGVVVEAGMTSEADIDFLTELFRTQASTAPKAPAAPASAAKARGTPQQPKSNGRASVQATPATPATPTPRAAVNGTPASKSKGAQEKAPSANGTPASVGKKRKKAPAP